jgi:hypothetical protein
MLIISELIVRSARAKSAHRTDISDLDLLIFGLISAFKRS